MCNYETAVHMPSLAAFREIVMACQVPADSLLALEPLPPEPTMPAGSTVRLKHAFALLAKASPQAVELARQVLLMARQSA